MYAGESLFLANNDGNLDQKHLQHLYDWTDAYKSERLEKVSDPHARNLVSRLLMKDPSMRPDASHALAHPFLSGKRAARMIGEEAEYDIFLSYRVNSDFYHCKLMYEMLTERGLRVWWDKKCLQPGVDWEEGFCEGLIKSRAFVPLWSRGGLQNFESLTESSRCDNVLLEYRLAAELKSFNLIECLFPVMIGDSSGDTTDPRACTYANYFKSGCSPNCPDVVVKSVEEKLCEHLNNQGLGAPVVPNPTVRGIFQSYSKYQGGFIQGAGGEAFTTVADSIHSMTRNVGDSSVTDVERDKSTVVVKRSEWDDRQRELDECRRELDILRTQKSELDILRSGMTKIYTLTSDTAGIIDASGPSNYSTITKVTSNIQMYSFSFQLYFLLCQEVARDVVVSVRSNIINAMNAVKVLQKYQLE